MKSFRVIAVLALLVAFPIISYLYLRSGYFYRLNLLKELEPKSRIIDFNVIDPNGTSFDTTFLKGLTTLLYEADNQENRDLIQPIFDEFSHHDDFRVIGLADRLDSTYSKNVSVTSSNKWLILQGNYDWNKSLCLVDTSLNIRSYYDFDSLSFTKLGQHIPILLPREKEKDVKMKEKINE